MVRVRVRVEYHGLPDRFFVLPLGAVIAVTDAELGWSEEPCLLEALEPRLARVVEHRFFGGLSEADIGELMGLSERTVRRDWVKARAWLYEQIGER